MAMKSNFLTMMLVTRTTAVVLSSCYWLLSIDAFTFFNPRLFHPTSPSCKNNAVNYGKLWARATTTKSTGDQDDDSTLDVASLKRLNECKSSTKARRLLENVLLDGREDALYKSITIPTGASSKGISDGDLAIQTRMVNKKYNIMDLIELSGDRDIDRASAALFGIMTGSTLTALVSNQYFPGPEILRFIVVWIFSFLPLFFVGYGISNVEKLQSLLVKIQRELFPVYRKRMIQHEAGRKWLLQNSLLRSVRSYERIRNTY